MVALAPASPDGQHVSLDAVTWEVMRAWLEQLDECKAMLRGMFQAFDVNRDEVSQGSSSHIDTHMVPQVYG